MTVPTIMIILIAGMGVVPFNIYWPLGKQDSTSTIHVGYGDWTPSPTEGPHPGIDFGIPEGHELVEVINPLTDEAYPTGYYPNTGNGVAVFLGYNPNDTDGWSLQHVEEPDFPYGLDFWDPQSQYYMYGQDHYDPGEFIICCEQTVSSSWIHLHLAWFEDFVWPFPPPYSVPGIVNPVDYIIPLTPPPSDYDEVIFEPIFEDDPVIGDRNVFFSPQGQEIAGYIYQSELWAPADIFVEATSQSLLELGLENIYANDMWCGVRSIRHRLLVCNPFSDPPYSENEEGHLAQTYGWRTLFEAEGAIPHNEADPWMYEALFADYTANSLGENRYIITNCYDEDEARREEPIGWDNILASDVANNDGEGLYSNGAWMIGRDRSAPDEEAFTNEEALYPDGAYRIEVEATSHGSRDVETAILPETPVEPNGPTYIAVNKYIPHIAEAVVYRYTGRESVEVLYHCGWEEDERPLSSSSDNPTRHKVISYSEIPPLGQPGTYGIGLKVSEPIDFSTVDGNDVVLIGRWGSEITYYSNRKEGLFEPIDSSEWPQGLGEIVTMGDLPPRYTWQLYECSGDLFPEEYYGHLHISVSNGEITDLGSTQVRGGDQTTFDANPLTIASPRQRNGEFPRDGVESGPDTTQHWGGPLDYNYLAASDKLIGKYNGSTLVEIDDFEQKFPHGYRGDCDYWCGFWTWDAEVGQNDAYIQRVAPNETDGSESIIETRYEYNGDLWNGGDFYGLHMGRIVNNTYEPWNACDGDIYIGTGEIKWTARPYPEPDTGIQYHDFYYAYDMDEVSDCLLTIPATWAEPIDEGEDWQALHTGGYLVRWNECYVQDNDLYIVAEDTEQQSHIFVLSPPENQDEPAATTTPVASTNDLPSLDDLAPRPDEGISVQNPCAETCEVCFPEGSVGTRYEIRLFDLSGRQVFRQAGSVGNGGELQLELCDDPSGVYYVVIKLEDQAVTRPVIRLR